MTERGNLMSCWAEQYEWGCTNEQHIWHNVTTNKYHFSNESSMFDEIGYNTMGAAIEALQRYADTL